MQLSFSRALSQNFKLFHFCDNFLSVYYANTCGWFSLSTESCIVTVTVTVTVAVTYMPIGVCQQQQQQLLGCTYLQLSKEAKNKHKNYC